MNDPQADGHPAVAAPPAALELPREPSATARARRHVQECFGAWGLDAGELQDDVLLLTSELVTNAVRHGGGQVTLSVSLESDHVHVAVDDGSPALPEVLLRTEELEQSSEGGRGVAIIASVASGWGVEKLADGGKRVWVRIARPPVVPAQREEPEA